MNFPDKLTKNIKQDINYQIKVAPAVIKVPITDKLKLKTEKDVKGNEIQYVFHDNKWFEIVKEVHSDYKGDKKDFFLIRVDKKQYVSAYPYNSFGYFVLPPELEAIYGKRCKVLSDIAFISNDIDQILVNKKHLKFEMGGLACVGDGVTASRFNPLTSKYEDTPCVCAWSRYYKDYTEEEVATEYTIQATDSPAIHRTLPDKKEQILVQGAWRDIESRSGAHVKLKPFKDNKPPCDFNFEIVFVVPRVPGVHLNKLHSTGIENYLRIESGIRNTKDMLSRFKVPIATAPMNLVLRVVTKESKVVGRRMFPQISLEFARSIEELFKRQTKNTFLEEGHDIVPELTEGTLINNDVDDVDDSAIETDEGEFEFSEEGDPVSALASEYLALMKEICQQSEDPQYVVNYLKENQITFAHTEDFYSTIIPKLNEAKLKLF